MKIICSTEFFTRSIRITQQFLFIAFSAVRSKMARGLRHNFSKTSCMYPPARSIIPALTLRPRRDFVLFHGPSEHWLMRHRNEFAHPRPTLPVATFNRSLSVARHCLSREISKIRLAGVAQAIFPRNLNADGTARQFAYSISKKPATPVFRRITLAKKSRRFTFQCAICIATRTEILLDYAPLRKFEFLWNNRVTIKNGTSKQIL